MRKIISAGAAVGVVAALGFAMPATAISSTSADLSVLHGIPGVTVDVWVNGERTLDDFAPGTLAGPLDLPAGTYEVVVTASDAADASTPVPGLGPASVTLEAGKSYTAVAHLSADGAANVLTPFVNDISATAAGQGRLTVRHVAAAPAVDVLAGGAAVVSNLSNPNEQTLNLPAGTVSASVAATGTTDPVIGPADVPVEDGKLTVVYAWGSLEDGNLALATQSITVGHSNPGGVTSGTAGYLAERDQFAQAAWIVGASAIAALGVVMFWMVRRTRVES